MVFTVTRSAFFVKPEAFFKQKQSLQSSLRLTNHIDFRGRADKGWPEWFLTPCEEAHAKTVRVEWGASLENQPRNQRYIRCGATRTQWECRDTNAIGRCFTATALTSTLFGRLVKSRIHCFGGFVNPHPKHA